MADSAMVSTEMGRRAADQPEVVRAAVLAGPGAVDERLAGRLWPVVVDPGLIERARVEAGHIDGRQRVLTGAVTVMIVLGLCLFRRESVGVVTARVTAPIPRVRIEGVPSGPAMSPTGLVGDIAVGFRDCVRAGPAVSLPATLQSAHCVSLLTLSAFGFSWNGRCEMGYLGAI